jgi:hypothetical protein
MQYSGAISMKRMMESLSDRLWLFAIITAAVGCDCSNASASPFHHQQQQQSMMMTSSCERRIKKPLLGSRKGEELIVFYRPFALFQSAPIETSFPIAVVVGPMAKFVERERIRMHSKIWRGVSKRSFPAKSLSTSLARVPPPSTWCGDGSTTTFALNGYRYAIGVPNIVHDHYYYDWIIVEHRTSLRLFTFLNEG